MAPDRPRSRRRRLATCAPFLVVSVLAQLAAGQRLGIDVTHAVDCTRKTAVGDHISVHYRGTLQKDGTEFDSSYTSNEPFEFLLGAGQVIAGWDQGLVDMCIGEQRRLTVPPTLAYGSHAIGKIPAMSTLVFDTELMAIDGVAPGSPSRPDVSHPDGGKPPQPSESASDKPEKPEKPEEPGEAPASSATATAPAASDAAETSQAAPDAGPMDHENNGECHLLGPYAIIVQAALGVLALSSLVYKRWRETPRRPLKIWFFDASKQVFGSVLLHLANILMSMLSSGSFDVASVTTQAAQAADGKQPNPCSFYLLNLAIDTTIGIPILVMLLCLLHRLFLLTPLANPPESLQSGNYGQPPRATWWLKQSVVYFLGLLGMKFCVFVLFQLLPWIAWIGDWALRWTEGNEAVQITFVMFVFPVIMNAIQYWIIDGFIKAPSNDSDDRYAGLRTEDDDEDNDDDASMLAGRDSGVDPSADDAWLERRRRESDDVGDGDGAAERGKETNQSLLGDDSEGAGRSSLMK